MNRDQATKLGTQIIQAINDHHGLDEYIDGTDQEPTVTDTPTGAVITFGMMHIVGPKRRGPGGGGRSPSPEHMVQYRVTIVEEAVDSPTAEG